MAANTLKTAIQANASAIKLRQAAGTLTAADLTELNKLVAP